MKSTIILLFTHFTLAIFGQELPKYDTINIVNNEETNVYGKQGFWKIYDKQNRIEKEGNYKDNKKVGEWLYYQYKKPRRKWIYHYDFSSGKKKLKWLYYTDGTCGYTYVIKNGRKHLTGTMNLSW